MIRGEQHALRRKQQRLLTEPLFSSWSGLGGGRSFVAAANVGVFPQPEQPGDRAGHVPEPGRATVFAELSAGDIREEFGFPGASQA